MKTKKSHDTNTTTTTAIAAWRTAEAANVAATKRMQEARAAAERSRPAGGHTPSTTRLELIEAELAHLEAENGANVTRAAATRAVDALDVAEGDELARACDIGSLHGDLVRGQAEIDRLASDLQDARTRWFARIEQARESHSALLSRRSADGLPPPAPVPSFDALAGPAAYIDALATRAAEGPPVKSRDGQIRRLRAEDTELRASIERAYRAEQERKREQAAADAWRASEREAEAKRRSDEHAAFVAAGQAEIAERDELAAAQRARSLS